jgi:hypothetical protein
MGALVGSDGWARLSGETTGALTAYAADRIIIFNVMNPPSRLNWIKSRLVFIEEYGMAVI